MFSIMVSLERFCVELANIFQNINAQIKGNLFKSNINDKTNTEDIYTIETVSL